MNVALGRWWRRSSCACGGVANRMMVRWGICLFVGECWLVHSGSVSVSSLSFLAPPNAWLTTSVVHTRTPDRGAHLHLFLHARGVLSAAVRMNILGPYAAQQLLLHAVKPLLDEALSSTAHLVSGALREGEEEIHPELAAEQLPATTWPLGEILSTRHDLLHSRIFNS